MDGDGQAYLGLEILIGMRAQSMGRDQNDLIRKMRELPQTLVTNYLSTNFIVHINDEQVVLKITGVPPPPPPLTLRRSHHGCHPV
jgi:hypothetical protein